jgi:two-component system CheB/CheR fusion protein
MRNLHIVGIGASAGGLDALKRLFDALPPDTGMAFVVVQHLSPDFKSLMPELLSKHTKMEIFTAHDKQEVKANCVYLNPRDKNLHIKGNTLFLLDKGPKRNLNLPIDIFFHTLGEEKKHESIGVILSGTGSDGSRGLKTIKEAGGSILVQSPESAQFDGMPKAAIETNLVDFTLTPDKIAEVLSKYNGVKPKLVEVSEGSDEHNTIYQDILSEIFEKTGIDFSNYKTNTLLRRIEKRMTLHNVDTLKDFHKFLLDNPKEIDALQQDFLIGVTAFFRDKPAFESLRDKVIPSLFANKEKNEMLRVWITGCSTGEEVYSIAILLEEHCKRNDLNTNFKIFASDIDDRALPIASAGVYSLNPESDLLSTNFSKYFSPFGDRMQIAKNIRDKVVFSNHNLLTAPPFIRMDLIICRNLLIYLSAKEQQKVYGNFQFALNKFGYLFLGNSESLGAAAKDFKTIDSKWKIYQSVANKRAWQKQGNSSGPLRMSYPTIGTRMQTEEYQPSERTEHDFIKFLANRFSPDCIFFDTDFSILYINGNAGEKLTLSQGVFQRNLLKMVTPEIASIIRNSVTRLKSAKHDVVVKNVSNKNADNHKLKFDLTFTKMTDGDNNVFAYVLQFSIDQQYEAEYVKVENLSISSASRQHIEELENQLKTNQAELQNVVEELETSNEELQSSNEELMSSNEELQSTNEELQSVNEELYSVNAELQERNKEVAKVSNDMTNLLNSTDIGTLFLDMELNIREFTPALKRHFELQENDLGRPISSFASNFEENTRESIIQDCKETLEQLSNKEREVVDKEGSQFLSRTSPFITNERKIEGVVITFVDITKLKQTQEELSETEAKYQLLFENLNEGFAHAKIIQNGKGEPIDWEYISINNAFESLTGLKKEHVVGKRISEVLPGALEDEAGWLEKYAHTALTGEEQFIQDYSAPLGRFYVVHVFSPKKGEFAATFADLSEMKQNELALEKANERFELATSLTGLALWEWDILNDAVDGNEKWKEIFGLSEENVLEEWAKNMDPKEQEASNAVLEAYLQGKAENYSDSYHYTHPKSGKKLWVRNLGKIIEYTESKEPAKMLGVSIDETAQKESKEKLVEATVRAESANIHKNQFLANMSHEIRTPMNGIVGFAQLLKEEELDSETKQQYVEVIETSSSQLLNLIDDIIDVSKLEAGEVRIEKNATDLVKLMEGLHTTYNELKKQRDKAQINISLELPEMVPFQYLETDEKRLRQVLINLLNNSLKFTEEGSIHFGFSVEAKFVRFYVSDDGIGIPQGKLDEIFERFNQVFYNSAKYGGTGLGLAISKGFVDMLGGSFFVESAENKGSVFSFTLPLNTLSEEVEMESKPEVSKEKSILENKTILVVDDTNINHMYLNAILKPTGVHIISAETGEEAVKLYKEHQDKIDLTLMDIRMPGINGNDAMSEILKLNKDALIIMQSAHAMTEEKENCLANGAKAYLTKPIDKDLLLDTVEGWMDK